MANTKPTIQEWNNGDNLILLGGWVRDGLTMQQVADNIGINRSTLYDWARKDKTISNTLKRTKEVADYEVVNALYKNAIEGNVTAQIFWLKNRISDKWREKQEVSHELNVPADKVEIVDNEDLEKYLYEKRGE